VPPQPLRWTQRSRECLRPAVLPQPSPERTAILRRLGLTRLVDQRELVAALPPRSEFVSTAPDEVA
jgi:hypothetical protein